MWPKLKEQLPAILLTAVLIVGAAVWIQYHTVKVMSAREDAQITPLRSQA